MLVRPRGDARLELEATGRYADGWLAPEGRISVWGHTGTVTLTLSSPVPTTVTFRWPGHTKRLVVGKQPQRVELPVASVPFVAGYRASSYGRVGERVVSRSCFGSRVTGGSMSGGMRRRIGMLLLRHARPLRDRRRDEHGTCNVCGEMSRHVYNSWILPRAMTAKWRDERVTTAFVRCESLFCQRIARLKTSTVLGTVSPARSSNIGAPP
jgi:hypothetical protein